MHTLYDERVAIMCQDVAYTRQRWAMNDYIAYRANMRYEQYRAADEDRASFILWSGERAEYARRAMNAMGTTDEDQYYA